jgi:hypothetical protein
MMLMSVWPCMLAMAATSLAAGRHRSALKQRQRLLQLLQVPALVPLLVSLLVLQLVSLLVSLLVPLLVPVLVSPRPSPLQR